ncbi:hypothetical protein D3C81_1534230 [compost metagenome]
MSTRRLSRFQCCQQARGKRTVGGRECALHGGQYLWPCQSIALHADVAFALGAGPIGLLGGRAGVLRVATARADQAYLALGDAGAIEIAVLIQQLLQHLRGRATRSQ